MGIDMSEPLYIVDCPYCGAMLPRFKDGSTATCKACGGEIRLLHDGEAGYDEWRAKLSAENKVKEKV